MIIISTLYPELIHTKFPNEVDTINNFVDVTLSTLPLAKQYYTLYNSGDIVGANKILADNPNLKYSYIGAETLNPIVDAIKAMQLFYTQDVQKYLQDIVKHRGEYLANVKYVKYNTVKYFNNAAWEVFMCISDTAPIGTAPTNTTYWIPLTMRGEQGLPGTGLTAQGAWSPTTAYPADSLVAHNNALWASKVANQGVTPTKSVATTWYLVMEFSGDYLTYSDSTTNKNYKIVVSGGKLYMEEVN